eukprot:7226651-Pyramimonas_sp.AAC.1
MQAPVHAEDAHDVVCYLEGQQLRDPLLILATFLGVEEFVHQLQGGRDGSRDLGGVQIVIHPSCNHGLHLGYLGNPSGRGG